MSDYCLKPDKPKWNKLLTTKQYTSQPLDIFRLCAKTLDETHMKVINLLLFLFYVHFVQVINVVICWTRVTQLFYHIVISSLCSVVTIYLYFLFSLTKRSIIYDSNAI